MQVVVTGALRRIGCRPNGCQNGCQMTEAMTPREAQIVELLRGGLTQRQVAERLGISRRTVEAHVARIRAKTGSATTGAALARARRGARPRPEHGLPT